MAVQRFEIDVDPNFEIHTSYHNDFFLLRTRVLVNGENTEIRSVKEGKYEGPVLNFCLSGGTVSTKLRLVASTVSPILVQYGVYHVDTFYYEQSPLFHVVFSSESCLKNFVLAIGEVRSALESQFQSLFSKNILESSQHLNVEIQPDLFLVSPNRQKTKGADLHLVTVENSSSIVTQWKDSKLFDFGSLYKEEAQLPQITSQPTSQDDVPPGKAVAFSVQAIGTELGYKWQWKQFGREGKKDGWQNLSGEGSTFKVEDIKASNAGYYRCVVSNSAGCETSQCASLTVAAELPDLLSELQDVNDWVTFGLYLGIKMPRLEAIKLDCPNLWERRTQMLNEWQKKVTPTWSAVVQALVGIGMRRLASKLAQKHGASSKLPDNDPLDHLLELKEEATASNLYEEVQKHRGDPQQDRRKLVDAEERLRQSQESKVKANERACEAVTKLEELHKNVEMISEEKSNLEKELKIKERECELLRAMQEKDAYNQVLQKKIDKKRKKIRSLKEKLQKKESELQTAMQEVHTQQEELSQAQKELKKQHEHVIQLQRETEELALSYNIEKEQVSKIVQLLVSDKEEMQQQLTCMKDESELKSKQIGTYSTEISHLSKEIEVLSSSLQEKEAVAAQLQRELEKREQIASAQLLGFIKLRTQIAELEQRLQEAEEQKQQVELARDATVQEMKARQSFKVQLHAQLDDPPKVTNHPKSLSKVSPGKPAMLTLQATGTEPLRYHWQWKPAEEEGGSEEWQPCHPEWSDGGTLTIPSVQKSNEGSYHCVISNYAGTQTSNPAKLSIANPPRVTTHPQEMKDAVPGKPVRFTTVATGTQPLSYQWEWKPPGEAAEESSEKEAWQTCNLERFPGADNSTITIPSVQKPSEGSYRCVVSNCAGSQTSNPAELSVAEPPRITTHPQELKVVVQGKPANFTVQATGTEPLRYNWQWKLPEEEGEWQPCPAEGSDGATLTIPSVQKSNEGSYRCVISNCAGNETSKPANLKLSLQLRWRRCRNMEYAMSWYPDCVVLERSVYVGGGVTGDDNQYIIQVYNLDTDNWSRLPRYQYKWFAISIINSRLTLVGGCDDRWEPTNQLAVYEPSSQQWTYPYHPMPTPRYRPAVLMYDIWLLVAGGCDDDYRDLATVELFNTSTHQWLAAASLPMASSLLTSATINNNAYVVTSSKQVFCVSLPDIVSQTVDQSTASKSPALWCRLPDTPLSCSTAISLRGYLIAVGGRHDNHTRTDIHLYQPESEQWTKVGDLPNTRFYCSCVVLPSGELLVAGGQESSVRTSRVDVASVLN